MLAVAWVASVTVKVLTVIPLPKLAVVVQIGRASCRERV